MEWEDWISPDAWEDSDTGNLTSWPSLKISVPFRISPVAKLQDFHHLGQFIFDDDQLQYLLVNLVHARGKNTIRDGVMVLRYKWPSQFCLLSEWDLKTVLLSLYFYGEAMQ